MTPDELKARTKAFALKIVRLVSEGYPGRRWPGSSGDNCFGQARR